MHTDTPQGYNIGMTRVNWDRWGAFASSVCAVHCLLTGVAFGLLSVVGLEFLGSEMAEWAFVLVTVGLGTTALIHGRRKHHSLLPAAIFALGMVFLLISKLAFSHSHAGGPIHAEDFLHTGINVSAGICLVTFHIINQRMQSACGGVHCSH